MTKASLMMHARNLSWVSLLALANCTSGSSGDSHPGAAKNRLEAENLGAIPENVSLLLLKAGTDTRLLSQTIERDLHGVVFHQLPRLLVARVPDGSDAALSGLGVATRFARAV